MKSIRGAAFGFVLGCYTQGGAFGFVLGRYTQGDAFGSALGYYAKPIHGMLFFYDH
jgi:hypothetical protein